MRGNAAHRHQAGSMTGEAIRKIGAGRSERIFFFAAGKYRARQRNADRVRDKKAENYCALSGGVYVCFSKDYG